MNKKTTTKHTITVEFENLKKRFYSGQLDIIQDDLHAGDVEHFEKGIKNLASDIQTIDDEGFRSLFQDGYTMVLLSGEEFDFVENFFAEKKSEEELIVAVVRNDKIVEEIHHSELSY